MLKFSEILNFLKNNSGKFLFLKNSNGSNGSVPRRSNLSTLVPRARCREQSLVGRRKRDDRGGAPRIRHHQTLALRMWTLSTCASKNGANGDLSAEFSTEVLASHKHIWCSHVECAGRLESQNTVKRCARVSKY